MVIKVDYAPLPRTPHIKLICMLWWGAFDVSYISHDHYCLPNGRDCLGGNIDCILRLKVGHNFTANGVPSPDNNVILWLWDLLQNTFFNYFLLFTHFYTCISYWWAINRNTELLKMSCQVDISPVQKGILWDCSLPWKVQFKNPFYQKLFVMSS